MDISMDIADKFLNVAYSENFGLEKVIQLLNDEEYRKEIMDDFLESGTFIIIEELYRKDKKEFIENLISNEEIIKNNLDVFFIEKIFKLVEKENKYKDLIDLLINNEKIRELITDSFVFDNNNNIFLNACSNGCTIAVDNMLNNEKIKEVLIGGKNVAVIEFGLLLASKNISKQNNVEVIKNILSNEEIRELISDGNVVNIFKLACENKVEELIDFLLQEKKIKEKIESNMTKEEIDLELKRAFFKDVYIEEGIPSIKDLIIKNPNIITDKNANLLDKNNKTLLYNVLNNDNFDKKDIELSKILIVKGAEINETNKNIKKNIKIIINNLHKSEESDTKKIEEIKKIKEVKKIIEEIKIYLNSKIANKEINENDFGSPSLNRI